MVKSSEKMHHDWVRMIQGSLLPEIKEKRPELVSEVDKLQHMVNTGSYQDACTLLGEIEQKMKVAS